MFGANINIFNEETMRQSAEFMQNCAEHPGCEGCKYNNETGVDGIICENAVERIKNVQ